MSGVRKIVEICASLDRPIQILCTSSIGVGMGWDQSKGPVPETPISDPSVATGNGYSASKYIVEQVSISCLSSYDFVNVACLKILANAAFQGIPAMSVRMGQACGPKTTGAWGTAEWVPILVKSSVALGCFPKMTGVSLTLPLNSGDSELTDWLRLFSRWTGFPWMLSAKLMLTGSLRMVPFRH
jgi:thioester reductase-like protein